MKFCKECRSILYNNSKTIYQPENILADKIILLRAAWFTIEDF